MKVGKSRQYAGSLGPVTGITAENYLDRASAYCVGTGKAFVIRAVEGNGGERVTGEPATDAQWLAWMAYFDAKGIGHVYARGRGLTTVPCEWPEDFDAEAPLSDRNAMLPRPRRAQVSKGRIAGLFARLGFRPPANEAAE